MFEARKNVNTGLLTIKALILDNAKSGLVLVGHCPDSKLDKSLRMYDMVKLLLLAHASKHVHDVLVME